jgi:hypothetical protein
MIGEKQILNLTRKSRMRRYLVEALFHVTQAQSKKITKMGGPEQGPASLNATEDTPEGFMGTEIFKEPIRMILSKNIFLQYSGLDLLYVVAKNYKHLLSKEIMAEWLNTLSSLIYTVNSPRT